MTPEEWQPVKTWMESNALLLRDAAPLLTRGKRKGKHALHLADASTRVLESSSAIWLVYREAVGRYAMPSEFQRPKSPPARPSPVDRMWFEIERLARTLVAASPYPMTLRTAVARVVEVQPELLERYRDAIRRSRRASGPCDRPRRRP
jgi:hypothetical protein